MLKKYLILLVFWSIRSLPAGFEIKELNLQDKVELDGLCALFAFPDNRIKTTADADEIRRLVYLPHNKTFISMTKATPPVVIGMLMCQYARNELDPSPRFYNFLDWDCFLSGRYKKTEYDAINYGTIAIHGDYRRHGVASELMNKAEQFCVDNGIDNAVLSVFKSNHKALGCYKKQGFEVLCDGHGVCKKLHKKITGKKAETKAELFIDAQSDLLSLLSPFHE